MIQHASNHRSGLESISCQYDADYEDMAASITKKVDDQPQAHRRQDRRTTDDPGSAY
jgi:hypothetical protein